MKKSETHTQRSIVVYVSREEKVLIKQMAALQGTTMSRYLLSLHKKALDETRKEWGEGLDKIMRSKECE